SRGWRTVVNRRREPANDLDVALYAIINRTIEGPAGRRGVGVHGVDRLEKVVDLGLNVWSAVSSDALGSRGKIKHQGVARLGLSEEPLLDRPVQIGLCGQDIRSRSFRRAGVVASEVAQ